MPRSDRELTSAPAMHKLIVPLLLCAAPVSGAAAAGDTVTFSYPAFNATTTGDLVAASNSSILTSASLLFERDRSISEFNRSEGFLLLAWPVDVWRAGPAGAPALEAVD